MAATILVSPRVGWTFRGALLAALTLLSPAPAISQVIYTVTDLGTLSGFQQSQGLGINASGQVAGYSTFNNNAFPPVIYNHAFRSSPSGQPVVLTDLGTLGGSDSRGLGINAAGQVTGTATLASLSTHAFRTTATCLISDPGTDLGTLLAGNSGSSFGEGINSTGQVTGNAAAPGGTHAFRSSPNGQPLVLTDLGVLPGYTGSFGQAINDAGQVAGYAPTSPPPPSSGTTRAFRTTPTGLASDPGADLGTLGGSQSRAFGINASGQVVGVSSTAFDLAQHAFRSSPNGSVAVLTDLGTLGGTFSRAYAINSLGVVVGESSFLPGTTEPIRGFVYDTQMRNLNDLISANSGWLLGTAFGINDAGQITGMGAFNGQSHAYLLTPVPEPGAMALVGGAAVALGLWRLLFRVRR